MFSLTWQKWQLQIWIIRGLLTYPCVLIVLFRNMCWNLLTSTGHTTSNYLYAGDVVGPGEWIPLPQVFRIRWFNSNIVILISNCKQKVKCLLFTIYRWLWRWSKTTSPGAANKWCCWVGWCPWEICGKQVSLCFTCKSSFCLCSKRLLIDLDLYLDWYCDMCAHVCLAGKTLISKLFTLD